jgi:hypothetical protein
MIYALKTGMADTPAGTMRFSACKTMYGGKQVAEDDEIFLFASETSGGRGLIAHGIVVSARAVAKMAGVARQTPRVDLVVEVMHRAKRPLGRSDLKRFDDWQDGRPETELNFKFYRQATDKLAGISEQTATFLRGFF